MHYCIKYRLKEDGTVPEFLSLDPNGVGGVYGVHSLGSSEHNDTIFIGISKNNATGSFEVIPTQQDLENYLISVGSGWKVTDPDDPTKMVSFDPVAAAEWVWQRKTNLDNSV